MSQEFLKKYHDKIDTIIKRKPVTYTTSSGTSENIVVHCYYIDSKEASISVYAVKNKKTHVISKYILKTTIDGTKSEITGHTAETMYNTLCAKHEAQIARTQLKKNFDNRAFARKR